MIRSITAAVLLIAAASAQSFEVASVKPAAPGQNPHRVVVNGGPGSHDPGLFTCQNCSLMLLVTLAYDVKNYQVSGPAWLTGERFDIAAKVPAGTRQEQFLQMQQNMLAERFKLELHRENKEGSIFELVAARNGPKLKESAADASEAQLAPAVIGPSGYSTDKDGYPAIPAGKGSQMVVMNGRARVQAEGESMQQLANRLGAQLGRPVANATGLKGRYDYTLSWAMDLPPGHMPPPNPGDAPVAAATEDRGPTLPAALQSQLGLRLESRRGPIETLVIDRIEKVPAEN
jgi:uncharacterized protein (TIGR03435 family)